MEEICVEYAKYNVCERHEVFSGLTENLESFYQLFKSA